MGAEWEADPRCEWINSFMSFGAIIPWTEEAVVFLPSCGMPARSFQLVIDGTTRESSELWEHLKYAAATQEALIKQCHLTATPPTLPNLYRDYLHPRLAP
jgi:hypothetical protein